MILPDTSIWISMLRKDDPDIEDILRKYLKAKEVVASTAVFGELLQGVKSRREREIIEIIWESLPKVEEQNLFIDAGKLSNKYRLYAKGIGLIDCYIIAACLKGDHALWTLDKKLSSAFDEIVN